MNKHIKELWEISHDGDDWGQCMAFWYAIADTLYREDGDIPNSWQYKPPLYVDEKPDSWPETEIDHMYQEGVISLDDLTYAGRVFERYSDLLKAQGKSY